MRIKITSQDENSIEFKIIREGHTLGNLIKDATLKDERVNFAGYTVKKPGISRFVKEDELKETDEQGVDLSRLLGSVTERMTFEEAVIFIRANKGNNPIDILNTTFKNIKSEIDELEKRINKL